MTAGTMASTSKIFTISSLNNATLTGAIYFPNNRIDISSINNVGVNATTAAPSGSAATSSSRRTTTTTSPAARRSASRRRASSRPRPRPDDRRQQGQGLRVGGHASASTSGPAAWRPTAAGNVMLEFALALPILALLLVGLLDLGSYSLQKSAMLQGARAGRAVRHPRLLRRGQDQHDGAERHRPDRRHGHQRRVLRMRVPGTAVSCSDDLRPRRDAQALRHRQHCQVFTSVLDGRHR